MIAVLLCPSLFGGCRGADPRADQRTFIEESVPAQRREELVVLVEHRDQVLDSLLEARDELVRRFRAVNSDYDASAEDLSAATAQFETEWEEHRDRLIDAALEMRAACDPEDWPQFAAFDVEVLLGAGPSLSDEHP